MKTAISDPARQRQSGQAIALLGLILLALIGFVGLAVDGGRAYLERRTDQNAVDAAVLAAGDSWQVSGSLSSAWQAAAKQYQLNKNITSSSSVSSWSANPLTVTWTGVSDSLVLTETNYSSTGKGRTFQATTTSSIPLAFMRVFGLGPNINIGSTAETVVSDQAQSPAILVLGQDSSCKTSDLTISGSTTVTVVGAIYSDAGITTNGDTSVSDQGNV